MRALTRRAISNRNSTRLMFGKALLAVSLATWQISNLRKNASLPTPKPTTETRPYAANYAHE